MENFIVLFLSDSLFLNLDLKCCPSLSHDLPLED